MLISDGYKELNKQLHAERPDYGSGSARWKQVVEDCAAILNTTSILDYGCGKGELAKSLDWLPIREYDPAVDGKDTPPEPAHLVVCTDVLEHVEPECVDAVLDDLRRLGEKSVILSICCEPASKTLADGRNAHLSVHPMQWWTRKLCDRWIISQSQYMGSTLFAIVRPE